MQLLKSSFWSFIWIGIKLGGSLAINKLISVTFGAQGIVLLSHFQNFYSTVLLVSETGINKGVIKYLSPSDQSAAEHNNHFSVGVLLNLFLYAISIILCWLFVDYFTAFFQIEHGCTWTIVLSIALLIMLLQNFLLSLLLASHKIAMFNMANICIVIITVPVVYFSLPYGIAWTLLSAVFGGSFFILISLIFFRRNTILNYHFYWVRKWSEYKLILDFVWMAAGIMIFGKVTEIFIRQYAINHFAIIEIGYWQSVVKLSDYYTTAFTTVLAVVYFPRLSAVIHTNFQLRKTVLETIKFLFPIAIIGFLAIYILRRDVLSLMFSTEFVPAQQWIHLQLITDGFKFISYFFVYLLAAQAQTKKILLIEAASNGGYLLLAYFFSKSNGVEGLFYAQLWHYIAYALYFIYLYRRLILNKTLI